MDSVPERIEDLASHCIRCGFCLESCPTFVLDGDETRSPRGRINLALAAERGELPWSAVQVAFDNCLGCRACETACPSGVRYGALLEEARGHMAMSVTQRGFVRLLSNPALSPRLVDLAQILGSKRVPPIPGLAGQKHEAEPPVRQPEPEWGPLKLDQLPPVRGEVYLLRGCLAGDLFPTTLAAVARLLRRVGLQVAHTPDTCCGAMFAHSGMRSDAQTKADHLALTMPGDLPIVVFTAGCGSALKEYGQLAHPEVAARVKDVAEVLLEGGLVDRLAGANALSGLTVTYHDACHLAHGQKVRSAPRELLRAVAGLTLVELGESDMCCGSAGTYNVFQPAIARRLLERKWANVAATGAHIVAQGNAGCHSWIAQAAREHGSTIRVMHTAEVLESAFCGLP